MASHPGDEGVCHWGCAAITNLVIGVHRQIISVTLKPYILTQKPHSAGNPMNLEQASTLGAYGVVQRAIEQHRTCPGLTREPYPEP